MADKSKTRMNLAAIKKVDPYAKDIVDTSSHVAFYIFNSEQNEWEKTDVEGAFFIYSRNAQPFHSIFINNRLNTTSFVEPITNHLELQAQAPFLLYRNERSRIRGFWFYNSLECERIILLCSLLTH
uniref:mRNA-decapping enzyme C-terminal domain-containing protein n=1 Tax=Glossina palpalis gambiensis TaxID=67801 RepID=A0A1B0BI92_9MUSC